jgi:hypothetical protein
MSIGENMDYANAIGGQFPAKGQSIAAPGELEALTKRIHVMASEADEIRGIAGRTADRLFGGGNAECASESPCRSGQVGEMEDALDTLSRELSDLRAQVERLARL